MRFCGGTADGKFIPIPDTQVYFVPLPGRPSVTSYMQDTSGLYVPPTIPTHRYNRQRGYVTVGKWAHGFEVMVYEHDDEAFHDFAVELQVWMTLITTPWVWGSTGPMERWVQVLEDLSSDASYDARTWIAESVAIDIERYIERHRPPVPEPTKDELDRQWQRRRDGDAWRLFTGR